MDDRHFPDDDLPLRPVEPKPDGPSWDLPEERPDRVRLEFDPMEEEAGGPSSSPGPGPGTSSPLRIALWVAALIALVLLSRDFWWPEEPDAPESAPKWVAAPHLPADAAPPPADPAETPVIEEEAASGPEVAEAGPVVDDGYDILQTEELASQEEIPAPVAAPREDVEIAAADPTPAPESPVLDPEEPAAPAVKREASPDRPALARRTLPPAPWEAGEQPTGLLRPGPGVQEPVPLDLPRYRYPPAARGTGLQVGVRLALLVDERGQVIDAVVREGGPEDLGFNQEALRIARNIPFQPASRYDIPGKMWTEMILEFAE
ncbi:MAG TPA: TonB family protein [Thermoanaerobaculia bacterium]|nr:TonB family protein [Thermoanaerobaculia bacterium]